MARKTVEGTRYIDIQQLSKIRSGNYTLNHGHNTASVVINGDSITIQGKHIYKAATRVGYGERTWFVCGCCGRNKKRLYQPTTHDNWFCRNCHELTYVKSQLSGNELEYVDYQIQQLQAQFDMTQAYQYGGLPGYVYEQIPLRKPKYMRWKRFYEIEMELKVLINRRIAVWMKMLKL